MPARMVSPPVVVQLARGRLVLPGHLGGQHLRGAVFPKAEVRAQKRQAALGDESTKGRGDMSGRFPKTAPWPCGVPAAPASSALEPLL